MNKEDQRSSMFICGYNSTHHNECHSTQEQTMSQVINSSMLSVPISEEQRAQCHFISNTHWDREWRYSAQRTRYMLVSMLDMLFDIFEKEPRFQSFHMDSQTLPIQDYLEARPEKEAFVRKYIEAGKLVIGPWFC